MNGKSIEILRDLCKRAPPDVGLRELLGKGERAQSDLERQISAAAENHRKPLAPMS